MSRSDIAGYVHKIPVNNIVVTDRLRLLRPEKVKELAESIQQLGLIEPIVVRRGGSGINNDCGYTLICGNHRLEAFKQLKLNKINCIVSDVLFDGDAERALLKEIDENLTRAELSPAERAAHIARRKEVYERLHPETKHGAAPGKAGGGKKQAKGRKLRSFVDDTARKTGKHRATIARDAKRGKDIPDVVSLAGTSLDSGAELDALAKLPEDEQRRLADRAKAGEVVSAAKDERAATKPPSEAETKAETKTTATDPEASAELVDRKKIIELAGQARALLQLAELVDRKKIIELAGQARALLQHPTSSNVESVKGLLTKITRLCTKPSIKILCISEEKKPTLDQNLLPKALGLDANLARGGR